MRFLMRDFTRLYSQQVTFAFMMQILHAHTDQYGFFTGAGGSGWSGSANAAVPIYQAMSLHTLGQSSLWRASCRWKKIHN